MNEKSYKNKIINVLKDTMNEGKMNEIKRLFEEGCYLDKLFLMHRAINKLLDYKLSEEYAIIGTTAKQAILIKIIYAHDKLTNDELSKSTNVVCSTITRTLDKMEKEGIIKRFKIGKNSFAKLTPKGVEMHGKVKSIEERIDTWIKNTIGVDVLDNYLAILKDVESKIYIGIHDLYPEIKNN